MVEHPEEVFESIVNGTSQILKLSINKRTTSMVYLSSMETYGQPDAVHENVTEDVSGYINPLESRSCYSLGKRMAENFCCDYFQDTRCRLRLPDLHKPLGQECF